MRSGGHCFAGRSSTTGLVIDVGPLDGVTVGDGTVTIGAGAKLAAVYDAPDPDLERPAEAYFGANAPRVLTVRRRYDPDGVLRPGW